jgi:syntaxin-binding protein 5
MIYDLDRAAVAPLKIPSFWKARFPKTLVLPVVSLALHPRDIGSLLIGCTEGAVIYSFKQNKVVKDFQIGGSHGPKLAQALWHPTGTFILIVSDDSIMSFWDPKDGRMVLARTIQEPRVNASRLGQGGFGGESAPEAPNQPIFKIAWCSKVGKYD